MEKREGKRSKSKQKRQKEEWVIKRRNEENEEPKHEEK